MAKKFMVVIIELVILISLILVEVPATTTCEKRMRPHRPHLITFYFLIPMNLISLRSAQLLVV